MWVYALTAVTLSGALLLFVHIADRMMQKEVVVLRGAGPAVFGGVQDVEIDVPAWAELSLDDQYRLLAGMTDIAWNEGKRFARIELLRVLVSLSRDFLNQRDGYQTTSTEEVREVSRGAAEV